jgi:hypothetical protein
MKKEIEETIVKSFFNKNKQQRVLYKLFNLKKKRSIAEIKPRLLHFKIKF